MKPYKCKCSPGSPCYKECEADFFIKYRWTIAVIIVIFTGLWYYLSAIL